jgi:hypothetical protein
MLCPVCRFKAQIPKLFIAQYAPLETKSTQTFSCGHAFAVMGEAVYAVHQATLIMKHKITTALFAVICIVGLSGCAGLEVRFSRANWVLHDTVYNDYYTDDGWSDNPKEAKLWRYDEAKRWLDDRRINEMGEYADTGPKDYPIKLERW